MPIGRRRFLRGAAGTGAALWLGAKAGQPARAAVPSSSGIDHIVVVTMENRSFDHFLGWLPNADGVRSTKPRFHSVDGGLVGNYHLTEKMGCAHPDPDHSYEGGRFQLHGGRLDNFARGNNDAFAVGYYNASDRPFMSRLAMNYTTCDRYFCGIMAETYPNRFVTHAGQTDRLHNSTTTAGMKTIWDRLNHPGGPTGRYYFSDVPFLALFGAKYIPISAPAPQFLIDAATGNLPNVSYLDPRFLDEGSGSSGDDHPHADIRAGDAFLAEAFHAVATGPGWPRTVFVLTYDEWGGFYDHVVPPRVTATSKVDKDLVGGRALLGFRVPTIIASPFTKGDPRNPRVVHDLFDHTSILKFIQSTFHLAPLTARDASTRRDDPGDLSTVLARGRGDTHIPADIPASLPPPLVVPCSPLNPSVLYKNDWEDLRASDLMQGWSAR